MVITRNEGHTFAVDSNGNRLQARCIPADKEIQIRRTYPTSYFKVNLLNSDNLKSVGLSENLQVAVFIKTIGELDVLPSNMGCVISPDMIAQFQIIEGIGNGSQRYFPIFKDLPLLQKSEYTVYYCNIQKQGSVVTFKISTSPVGTPLQNYNLVTDFGQGNSAVELNTNTSVADEIMTNPGFIKEVEDRIDSDINRLSRKYIAC